MRWLPEAVNLRDRWEVERARRTLASLSEPPRLLVVDTMARSMVGGDENAVQDVGEFIAAVDGLCPARFVVHHTGHEASRERGSSALSGAADLRVKLERAGKSYRVELTCEKQKDAREWDPITLRLDEHGASLAPTRVVEKDEQRDELRAGVLAYVTEQGPASKRAIRASVTGRNADIDAALDALESDGVVHRTSDGYAACPEAPGTPGHTRPATPGAPVPGEGPPYVVGGPEGMVRVEASQTGAGTTGRQDARSAPPCSCACAADLTADGRCERCYGLPRAAA
jgi:hypothetical protein